MNSWMGNALGWSVIEVPVTDGTILIEFFSGNIAHLAHGLTASSMTEDTSGRLKQLGILANTSARLEALDRRWREYCLKTKATQLIADLTCESPSVSDVAQTALRSIVSQRTNDAKHIVLGIVAGKNPIEAFLTEKWVKDATPHVADGLGRVFIATEDLDFVMGPSLVSLERFLSLISTKWGNSYKLSLVVILNNPKDIMAYLNPIRRLLQGYGLETTIYLKAEEVVLEEKLAELGDMILKHQLYGLIPRFYVIPASTSLHGLLFGCSHNMSAKFYSKLFRLLFEEDLLRIVRVVEAGVLKSIDNFLYTHLFLPPNFMRCGSSRTLFLKNSKAYCCSEDVRKERFVDLNQQCAEKSVTEKLSDYRRTHFLYGRVTKDSLLTYGGVCPHEPLEIQCQRGLALLSSFFEHFVCLKRGELK